MYNQEEKVGFLFCFKEDVRPFCSYVDVKISLSDSFIQKNRHKLLNYILKKTTNLKVLHVVLCAGFARENRTKIFYHSKLYHMVYINIVYIYNNTKF